MSLDESVLLPVNIVGDEKICRMCCWTDQTMWRCANSCFGAIQNCPSVNVSTQELLLPDAPRWLNQRSFKALFEVLRDRGFGNLICKTLPKPMTKMRSSVPRSRPTLIAHHYLEILLHLHSTSFSHSRLPLSPAMPRVTGGPDLFRSPIFYVNLNSTTTARATTNRWELAYSAWTDQHRLERFRKISFAMRCVACKLLKIREHSCTRFGLDLLETHVFEASFMLRLLKVHVAIEERVLCRGIHIYSIYASALL